MARVSAPSRSHAPFWVSQILVRPESDHLHPTRQIHPHLGSALVWVRSSSRLVARDAQSNDAYVTRHATRPRDASHHVARVSLATMTTWVPLEANPELFNAWASALGLDTSKYAFYDIFGLDPELLAMVPGPVEAVLLLFPLSPKIEAARQARETCLAQDDLLWFPQTIGNACGTIGLLHAIANSAASQAVQPDTALAHLLSQARSVPAEARPDVLVQCEALRNAHATTAAQGQTTAPDADDDVDLHFIAFVRSASSGALIELDGRQSRGPIVRLPHIEADELLPKAAAYIQQHYMAADTDQVQFNLIALSASV